MNGLAHNCRVGVSSALVAGIALPACLIFLQLVRSLFAPLHSLLSGIGGLLFLVVAVILINVGSRKLADNGFSLINWIVHKTRVHQSIAAAVSMIIGILIGVLGGAVIYRLIWMAIPGLAAQ